MKLELDERIKSLSDVFNFSDVENAKQFIGQKGYFTNNIYFLKNIQLCQYGTLVNIFSESFSYNTFRMKEDLDCAYYEFFIPESFLKSMERKYIPYTLKEFFDKFTVGSPIMYREKGDVIERYLILNGYVDSERGAKADHYIYIGSTPYTLDELFNKYEWQDLSTRVWKPFGVEVEE